MRVLLLLFALSLPLAAQESKSEPWIGTLEATDSAGRYVARITASIAIDVKARRLDGHWNGLRGSSGTVTGTVDEKGRVKATLTMFANGVTPTDSGEIVEAERCRAEAKFEGHLYSSGVLQLTTARLRADTPSVRATGRACEDLTRIAVLLQPHEH